MKTVAISGFAAGVVAHPALEILRRAIGARMVRRGHYVTFQMPKVAVSRQMFVQILARIVQLRAPSMPA